MSTITERVNHPWVTLVLLTVVSLGLVSCEAPRSSGSHQVEISDKAIEAELDNVENELHRLFGRDRRISTWGQFKVARQTPITLAATLEDIRMDPIRTEMLRARGLADDAGRVLQVVPKCLAWVERYAAFHREASAFVASQALIVSMSESAAPHQSTDGFSLRVTHAGTTVGYRPILHGFEPWRHPGFSYSASDAAFESARRGEADMFLLAGFIMSKLEPLSGVQPKHFELRVTVKNQTENRILRPKPTSYSALTLVDSRGQLVERSVAIDSVTIQDEWGNEYEVDCRHNDSGIEPGKQVVWVYRFRERPIDAARRLYVEFGPSVFGTRVRLEAQIESLPEVPERLKLLQCGDIWNSVN